MSKFVLACLVLLIAFGVLAACPIPASSPVYAAQAQCYAPAQTYYAPTYLAYPVTLQVAIPTVAVPAQQVVQLVPQQQIVPQSAPIQQQQQIVPQQQEVQMQPQVQATVQSYSAPVIVQRQVAAYYAAPVAVQHSYAAQAAVGYGAVRGANVVVQRQVIHRAPISRVIVQRQQQRQGILGRLFGRLRGNGGVPARSTTRVIVR
jgi:hypothetical protein